MPSIVCKSLKATPEGVSPFVVIDGQQRLTTLTLLLAALRDVVRESDTQQANKIHDRYLTNDYVSDNDVYKVLPTQADRTEYFAVIDGKPVINVSSSVRQAYEYFCGRCRHKPTADEEAAIDLKKMAVVVATGLELVSITLDEPDNEYRIFESLNAKGAELTQADLLRNYFFMNIPPANSKQDRVYDDVWLPMQRALGPSLEDFFRYTYMSGGAFFDQSDAYKDWKGGTFVRQGDVYQEWKRRLDKLALKDYTDQLATFAHASRYYNQLIDPKAEPNAAISEGLTRLNRWGSQTVYPFLLYAYAQYDVGAVDATGVVEILRMIEPFLVRRLFAGVPTNGLNRIFLRLSQQVPTTGNVVEGTRAALSEPGRRWPRDDDFRRSILSYPLYLDSRPDQRKLILERLEASFGHKEALSNFDTLSIEHIMPQTLTDEWRSALGTNADDVYRRYIHVLGNLTLTGYNPDLSNKPFSHKKVLLADSNIAMNKAIAKESEWTAEKIEERGRLLADRAVDIWPGPQQ